MEDISMTNTSSPSDHPLSTTAPPPLNFPPSFLTALESAPSSAHPPPNPHATLPRSHTRRRAHHSRTTHPPHTSRSMNKHRRPDSLERQRTRKSLERASKRRTFIICRERARGRDLMREMWRLLAVRGQIIANSGQGGDAIGLPATRLRVLKAKFDKRSPLLGGEDGFVREKRILETGCEDLERVIGELRGECGDEGGKVEEKRRSRSFPGVEWEVRVGEMVMD